MRVVRDRGLSLFFLAIFLLSLAGQAVAGFHLYNDEEVQHAALLRESPETISSGAT